MYYQTFAYKDYEINAWLTPTIKSTFCCCSGYTNFQIKYTNCELKIAQETDFEIKIAKNTQTSNTDIFAYKEDASEFRISLVLFT